MDNKIEIKGVEIHYRDTGNRDSAESPVVLMHGWGCTADTVVSIASILEPRRRVININLPGHGASGEPPLLPDGKPWGVYEYAEAVKELLSSLGIERPALIGHSYGGRVAIILGSEIPAEKIMLVDSAGIKPKRKPLYYIKIYSYKAMKHILPALFGKRLGEKLLERWRGKSGSADYRKASPMMRMVMSRSVNQDLRHLLPSIKAPTLLVWGEEDTATPLSDAKLMESLIPDAGLVSFKGCGHYSFLDNPGGFAAVTKSFFKIPR